MPPQRRLSTAPGLCVMVQGRWQISITTPMGEKSGVLDRSVSGDTLTGSLSDGEHHVAISDGKVSGNELRWSAKITKPMRMSFKFTAIVEENRISGTARQCWGPPPSPARESSRIGASRDP
jgi:hypothetical protein